MEFDSEELIRKAITHIDDKMFVAKLQYTVTTGTQEEDIKAEELKGLDSFVAEKSHTYTLERSQGSLVPYDLVVKIAEGAKLPKGFFIPTPVGNYSPDWAIAFNKGTVKHIFFIAETKGTMETLNLKPIEQAKINCAKKLFNELSTADVVYHDVKTCQDLINIMEKL